MLHNKMVGLADYVTPSRNLEALRKWWDILMQIGPNYDYFPQPTKSWLIVKENKLEEAARVFEGTNIQISTEGKRHLGAVIGMEENKKNYTNDKISEWTKKINMLANIATTHTQTAYTAYVTSYQHTSYELFPILTTSLKKSMRLYDSYYHWWSQHQ